MKNYFLTLSLLLFGQIAQAGLSLELLEVSDREIKVEISGSLDSDTVGEIPGVMGLRIDWQRRPDSHTEIWLPNVIASPSVSGSLSINGTIENTLHFNNTESTVWSDAIWFNHPSGGSTAFSAGTEISGIIAIRDIQGDSLNVAEVMDLELLSGFDGSTSSWKRIEASLAPQARLLRKLRASDGAAGDLFGWSCAISEDRVLIDAHRNDDQAENSGSAYLFDLSSGEELDKFSASSPEQVALFGAATALESNHVLIAARLEDGANGHDSGAVYHFDAAAGGLLHKFTSDDIAPGDGFGTSVAISNNLALISAWNDDDNGENSGSAYVFDLRTGVQLRKISPSDGITEDRFGRSADLDGATGVIGAHLDNPKGLDSGSAYLYDVQDGELIHKLVPEDGSPNDQFGYDAAISGDRVIVGAYLDDVFGLDSGSAYIFDRVSGEQLLKLTPDDGAAEDHFGWSVDISGYLAIVGARRDDDLGEQSGSVYVFDAYTGEQIYKLTANDGAAVDLFGTSVSIDGNSVAVGSYYDDDNGEKSGSVYIYDLALPQPSLAVSGPNGNSISSGESVDAGDYIINEFDHEQYLTFTIQNTGDKALRGLRLSGEATADYELESTDPLSFWKMEEDEFGNPLEINFDPDAVLGAGESLTFRLFYHPVPSLGTYTQALRIHSNDASGPLEFSLEATVIPQPSFTLSSLAIDENPSVGDLVATLSNEYSTYSLVSGEGSTNNSAFMIVGNELQVRSTFWFNHETYPNLQLRVRGSNADGSVTAEETFVIAVNDVNEAPTTLGTSGRVAENDSSGSSVDLVASDPDENEVLNFFLVSGDGDDDNALFEVSGEQLVPLQPLDYESAPYRLRLRVADSGNLSLERPITFYPTDVLEGTDGSGSLPTVSLLEDLVGSEGESVFLTFQLDTPSQDRLKVNFLWQEGTAQFTDSDNPDFTSEDGRSNPNNQNNPVVIEPGETQTTVEFQLKDDSFWESQESATVEITSVNTLGNIADAGNFSSVARTLTIGASDPLPPAGSHNPTWQLTNHELTLDGMFCLNGMHFANETYLRYSEDGGQTWFLAQGWSGSDLQGGKEHAAYNGSVYLIGNNTSSDGKSWTQVDLPQGQMSLVGGSGSFWGLAGNHIYHSFNGQSWTLLDDSPNNWGSKLMFANGRAFSYGSNGIYQLSSSSVLLRASLDVDRLAFGGGVWIAVGSERNAATNWLTQPKIWRSTDDGWSWTERSSALQSSGFMDYSSLPNDGPEGAHYAHGRFIVHEYVDSSPQVSHVATSTDGWNWQNQVIDGVMVQPLKTVNGVTLPFVNQTLAVPYTLDGQAWSLYEWEAPNGNVLIDFNLRDFHGADSCDVGYLVRQIGDGATGSRETLSLQTDGSLSALPRRGFSSGRLKNLNGKVFQLLWGFEGSVREGLISQTEDGVTFTNWEVSDFELPFPQGLDEFSGEFGYSVYDLQYDESSGRYVCLVRVAQGMQHSSVGDYFGLGESSDGINFSFRDIGLTLDVGSFSTTSLELEVGSGGTIVKGVSADGFSRQVKWIPANSGAIVNIDPGGIDFKEYSFVHLNGFWIVSGSNSSTGERITEFYRSHDGVSWTQTVPAQLSAQNDDWIVSEVITVNGNFHLTYQEDRNGERVLLSSSDGLNWVNNSFPDDADNFTWTNGEYLAFDYGFSGSPARFWRSSNLESWSTVNSSLDQAISGSDIFGESSSVVHDGGLYYASGDGWLGTSENLENWQVEDYQLHAEFLSGDHTTRGKLSQIRPV